MSIQYTGLNTLTQLTESIKTGYVKKTELNENLKVVKKTTATEGYSSSYELRMGEKVLGDVINIPKDYLVKSCEKKVCETADVPEAGYKVGDKYIDWTINTVSGDGNESHIYINVQDLVDVYNSGNGVTVGTDNTISLKVDTDNANGLDVGTNGLSLALASSTTPGAMSAQDKTDLAALKTAQEDNLTNDDFVEISAEKVKELMGDATPSV